MTAPDLNPTQLAVLEVFRRLQQVKLGPPSVETVAQLTHLNLSAAGSVCREMVELGVLRRYKRGFALNENQPADAPEREAA